MLGLKQVGAACEVGAVPVLALAKVHLDYFDALALPVGPNVRHVLGLVASVADVAGQGGFEVVLGVRIGRNGVIEVHPEDDAHILGVREVRLTGVRVVEQAVPLHMPELVLVGAVLVLL